LNNPERCCLWAEKFREAGFSWTSQMNLKRMPQTNRPDVDLAPFGESMPNAQVPFNTAL
jgi:hypothetical protein